MPEEKKLSKQNELFAQIVAAMDELGLDVISAVQVMNQESRSLRDDISLIVRRRGAQEPKS